MALVYDAMASGICFCESCTAAHQAIALGAVGISFDDRLGLLFRLGVLAACEIKIAQGNACLQVVGIKLHRLAHLAEGFAPVLQLERSVAQLVVRLRKLGVDLNGLLELNGSGFILLAVHVLHAAVEILLLGLFGIAFATREGQGRERPI